MMTLNKLLILVVVSDIFTPEHFSKYTASVMDMQDVPERDEGSESDPSENWTLLETEEALEAREVGCKFLLNLCAGMTSYYLKIGLWIQMLKHNCDY
jgi:hypothetical protein